MHVPENGATQASGCWLDHPLGVAARISAHHPMDFRIRSEADIAPPMGQTSASVASNPGRARDPGAAHARRQGGASRTIVYLEGENALAVLGPARNDHVVGLRPLGRASAAVRGQN